MSKISSSLALSQLLFPLCWELPCHTGWGNKARTASWWSGSFLKASFVCFLPSKGQMMSWSRGGGTRKLLVTLRVGNSLHNLPCHTAKSCGVTKKRSYEESRASFRAFPALCITSVQHRIQHLCQLIIAS